MATAVSNSSSTEILHDFSPLIRVYKDGRTERLVCKDVVPSSTDPETGVQSKDVPVSPDLNVFARLYLPAHAKPGDRRRFPVLVYYHGGGFLVGSAFSPTYHRHLNLLVREANVVVVSVEYRLAPEHPLPTAYEDSWVAIKWVASHSDGDGDEVWLNDYADFSRLYLGGDSAGGNIAHNMAVRVGLEGLLDGRRGLNVDGLLLSCPYFWRKGLMDDEEDGSEVSSYVERLWHYAYPTTSGLDDPLIDPAMNPNLSNLPCKRVLVYVAEKDVFRVTGWYYKEVLCRSGWVGDLKVVEVEGEEHIFYLYNPTSEKSMGMLRVLASFLNPEKA